MKHLTLYALPVSVAGIFAPLATTASFVKTMEACVLKKEAVKQA